MGAAKQGRIIKLQLLFLFFLPLAIWCLVFSVDRKICISVYYIHSSIYYFMRVPWTARRSNQSIVKKISPGISLEGMMLKLKLQYFGHFMQSWLIGKDSDAGRDWGQEEKGTTEDEMAGWHHWLNGLESEWTPGVCDGQGGLHAVIHGVAKSRTGLSDWSDLIGCFHVEGRDGWC